MSEKGKIAVSELGVQPFAYLCARAKKRLEDGAEQDNVAADELQGWLQAFYKDQIQPQYEDARHSTMLRILDSATLDALVEPEVEQWFSGYVPSAGQDSWHPGVIRTVISVNGVQDAHQLAQFELDQKRAELEHDAVADETYFREQLLGIFARAGASVYIEPFDVSNKVPPDLKPGQSIVRIPGGYAVSRGKSVAYSSKSLEYLEEFCVNINGVVRPHSADKATIQCISLMAHTEILHEYGIVIKNIGETMSVDPLITQEQNEVI